MEIIIINEYNTEKKYDYNELKTICKIKNGCN